ncbi:hypothetical protein [Vulcanisaeta sp. JCM 16161]|uniref:hypothetical protein n=1 Tax=Vulcanisaeta sp. JCM 16161 TaxID=1295372 RepID=UPI001FB26AD3|nr:hypothetical protein [Vulcanisaeta sp. JCM 16161]
MVDCVLFVWARGPWAGQPNFFIALAIALALLSLPLLAASSCILLNTSQTFLASSWSLSITYMPM